MVRMHIVRCVLSGFLFVCFFEYWCRSSISFLFGYLLVSREFLERELKAGRQVCMLRKVGDEVGVV
jgi:hypothetical protein